MRIIPRLIAVAFGTCGLLAGCNLVFGIEEHGAQPVPVEAAADTGGDVGDAGRPTFEKCKTDGDCVAPNGCYTPKCDTVLGACTYALCEAKDRTCAAGVCDEKTYACSDPQPYSFVSTSYDVAGVTFGCGPNPRACAAAAFPFLFLGTRDDVVALLVDDFVGKTPIKVPIVGLAVRPQQIIASGRRIWVLGAVEGQAPPYQLPISTLDVPSDPTVTSLHARTAVVTYPFPSVSAFAAPNGGLYLAYGDSVQGLPSLLLTDAIADGTILTAGDAGASKSATVMYRATGAPVGASIVAASGNRLVAYRAPFTFNLISSAGTQAAATQPDVVLAAPAAPINATSFAQGPDGTVMMAAMVADDPPLPDCNCTSHARLSWVFADAIATTTLANQFLDPDGYTNPQIPLALCHVCTGDYYRSLVVPTWLDRRSALVATPFGDLGSNRTTTDVRFLARDPLDGNTMRRAQTKATDTPKGDFATDRIVVTSANGIGYLVLADSQGNDVTLSIVDPRCNAK